MILYRYNNKKCRINIIFQEIYYINKYELEEHISFNNMDYEYKEKYLCQLIVRINYFLQVNTDDIVKISS